MLETKENSNNVLLDDAASGTHRSLDEAVGGEIKMEDKARGVQLAVREYDKDPDTKLRAKLDATLAEVLDDAGKALGKKILPPGNAQPLDKLRGQLHDGKWSKPITDLDQLLGDALKERFDKRFAVEYVRAVKINTIWGISPKAEPTPRELLEAFGMDAAQFTLYPPDSNDAYPVDTQIKVERGQKFEAQKDGKYGDHQPPRGRKPRGTQTIEDDVKESKEAGASARLFLHGEQKYVEASVRDVPSPPWTNDTAQILIAVSATYPSGGLDAFYIKLPFGHESGDIPRKQNVLTIEGVEWLLISWHYHPSKPWSPTQDDLVTHIEHCRGFFLTRGVKE